MRFYLFTLMFCLTSVIHAQLFSVSFDPQTGILSTTYHQNNDPSNQPDPGCYQDCADDAYYEGRDYDTCIQEDCSNIKDVTYLLRGYWTPFPSQQPLTTAPQFNHQFSTLAKNTSTDINSLNNGSTVVDGWSNPNENSCIRVDVIIEYWDNSPNSVFSTTLCD